MKPPLISVVITTFNRSFSIAQAIDSVLSQTYRNWEIIIVDDGSTDRTSEIVRRYLGPRVSYFYKKNGGISSARNFGMSHAKGDYLVFLDSDDEFEKDKLKTQYEHMLYSKTEISISNCIIVKNKKRSFLKKFDNDFYLTIAQVIHNSVPSGSGLLMMTKTIYHHNKYNEALPIGEDFDFMLRLMGKYKVLFISTPLIRIHKCLDNGRMSSQYDKKIIAYDTILQYTKKKYYHLTPEDHNLLLKILYLQTGFFRILNGDRQRGRSLLRMGLDKKPFSNMKYRLIYLFSFYPPMIHATIKTAKYLWGHNIIKT